MTAEMTHDIVVIGASAGGVEALMRFTAALPHDLPASIFVVVHIPARSKSMLPAILSRCGPLPATHAIDGAIIEPGWIYVAPPNHHLLVRPGQMAVTQGPRENRQRPAVDPLFRSAARAYGRQVVGVVLSGSLDDGASGLVAIKSQGGTAIVQDPSEALFDSMPRSAIETVAVDLVLPADQIANEIARLAVTPVTGEELPVSADLDLETRIAAADPDALNGEVHLGEPASLGCPECGGTLWELQEGNLTRFRCRVGHAYTAASLLDEQADVLEDALWAALRNLEEQSSLYRRLADRAEERGSNTSLRRFRTQQHDATGRAEVVRRFLLHELESSGPVAS